MWWYVVQMVLASQRKKKLRKMIHVVRFTDRHGDFPYIAYWCLLLAYWRVTLGNWTFGNQQLERITSCIGLWRVKATKEKVWTWQISLVFSTRGSNDMKQLKRGRSLSKTTFEGYFTTSFHCCVANISESQKCCHSSYPYFLSYPLVI